MDTSVVQRSVNVDESHCRDGIAPIKKEYLIPKEDLLAAAAIDLSLNDVADIEVAVKADNRDKRKERKGMNKHRMKEMKQSETNIRAAGIRLCPSVLQPTVECKFGDKCTCLHDVSIFLDRKPADISEKCPIYDFRGICPYSFACRFGSAHIDNDLKQLEKSVEKEYKPTKNTSSIHIQIALRKKTYDFSRAEKALIDLKQDKVGSMEREKTKLDMKALNGKKYLAPLTTVGNLPFRRLCVDYGADITCGEMAVATSLLAGTPSEYSLLKRHDSEKIFGVQLAGGFPDTMSKAAQILVDEMECDFIDVNMGCPIDLVNQKGGGCALPNRPKKMAEVLSAMQSVMRGVPLTVKIRSGLREGILTADETIRHLASCDTFAPHLITFHPRSKEQRYTKLAHWEYVDTCVSVANHIPLWVCGDVLSWQEYYQRLDSQPISGIMIGRGALIKPWIFTEIDEKRTWDITASERLDLIKKFVNYGLDHWGSDDAGVERVRRFLLEWLSFQHRYIPVGLLEVIPQKMNDRPPQFKGRCELETLLSSPRAADWVHLSTMFLGPTPNGFSFIPKHKASSY